MASFDDLGVASWLCRTAKRLKLLRPTEVQVKCIPKVLSGRCVAACAATGSGKTAAFVLPILQELVLDPYGVFALVISPTRELAAQIVEQFDAFGCHANVRISLLVGGMERTPQAHSLASLPHVVVATPDRLLSFVESTKESSNPFRRLRYVVLDEADRLLQHDLFRRRLGLLMEALPTVVRRSSKPSAAASSNNMYTSDAIVRPAQVILMSATLKAAAQESFPWPCETHRKVDCRGCGTGMAGEVNWFVVGATGADVDDTAAYSSMPAGLKEQYIFVPHHIKVATLWALLTSPSLGFSEEVVLVFFNSCAHCEILGATMKSLGLPVRSLTGLQGQRQRDRALESFRAAEGALAGSARFLFATDVAARGLDIPGIAVVVQFDVATDVETYIHRAGRTARAGKEGLNVCIVSQHDSKWIPTLEAGTGKRMVELALPKDAYTAALDAMDDISSALVAATTAVEFEFKDVLARRRASASERPSRLKQWPSKPWQAARSRTEQPQQHSLGATKRRKSKAPPRSEENGSELAPPQNSFPEQLTTVQTPRDPKNVSTPDVGRRKRLKGNQNVERTTS